MKFFLTVCIMVLVEFILNGQVLPPGWQKAVNWKGTSNYIFSEGEFRLERSIDDQGAGGVFSPLYPVEAGKRYFWGAEISHRLMNEGIVQVAIKYVKEDGTEFGYAVLYQGKGLEAMDLRENIIDPPPDARRVKFLFVLNGMGSMVFKNHYLGEGPFAFETLRNEKLTDIRHGVPAYWSKAVNWQGESSCQSTEGEAVIVRTEEGAGAFLSRHFKVIPETMYDFQVRIKPLKVNGQAETSIRFFDEQGRIIHYQLLFRSDKTLEKWQEKKVRLTAPSKAASAVLMLVLSGAGTAHFADVSFREASDPVMPGAVNLLLNSSFEESDLNAGFIDCFKVKRGSVARTSNARHGFHALELQKDSGIVYGGDSPSIGVKPGETLYYRLSASGKGAVTSRIVFFSSGGKANGGLDIPLPLDQAAYQDFSGTVIIPPEANYITFELVNTGAGPIAVDALYLGRQPFNEKYLPRPVPVFPEPEKKGALALGPGSTIRDYQGIPTWFIGEEPVINSIFAETLLTPGRGKEWTEYNRNVLRAGQFPIVMLQTYMTPEISGEKYTLSSALNHIDYQVKVTQSVLPNAKFFIWLALEPTMYFAENYPDELLYAEGGMAGKWLHGFHQYSYGSEVWGKYCAGGLKRLICELRRRPYGDRIVGMAPGLGRFGENNYAYAVMTDGYLAHDVGPAMTNFFRKWLLREYGGDVTQFRRAWNTAAVQNFTDVQVPGKLRRRNRKNAFDHAGRKDVFDYSRCESQALLHRILEQVRIVKEYSDFHWFTMAQIAYFTEGIFHRELDLALKNPYLDSLGPAPPYINRGPGDDVMDHGPSASVRHAGKIWFFQADVRSHLCPAWDLPYGSTASLEESINIYLRDIGHYMTTGAIPYHMSFSRWFDEPALYKLLGRFDEWMQLSSSFSRKSKAEIAVVASPLSIAAGYEYNYTRRFSPPFQSTLSYNRQLEWHHLGAPYDYFLLDDLLESADLDQYKLIVMADTFALNTAQRKLIQERLHRNNRTVLYLYAPGFIHDDAGILSKGTIHTQICGFDLDIDDQEHNLAVNLTEAALRGLNMPPDYATAGFFRSRMYGGFTTPDKPLPIRPEIHNPRFRVKPAPNVEILGYYDSDGAAAFARRRERDHTLIYWGSTALDRDILFGLAEKAGVHLYTRKKAVVYANNNFAVVHVPEPGKYTVRLPRKVESIFDLYAGKELAVHTDAFEKDFAKYESSLFYFGDRTAIDEALVSVREKREKRLQENLKLLAGYTFSPEQFSPLAKEAERTIAYRPDAGGFIRHWQLLGPFPNPENTPAFSNESVDPTAPDFSRSYPVVFRPETDCDGKAWGMNSGEERKMNINWRPLEFSNGITAPLYEQIDSFFTFNRIIYYLACWIELDSGQTLTLCAGSDDGHRIYINGKPVSAFAPLPNGRSLSCDSETSSVTLSKGRNLIIAEIIQSGGGLGHAIRFRKHGKVFTDYRVKLE